MTEADLLGIGWDKILYGLGLCLAAIGGWLVERYRNARQNPTSEKK